VDPTSITIALTSRILRSASHGAAVTIDDPNFDNTARLFFSLRAERLFSFCQR
jgi:hypothetical protein